MNTHTITLHADELEYTSRGLNTASHIDLKVGTHNKIVVVQPKRVTAIPVGVGGFEANSTFPTPVVLFALIAPSLHKLFDGPNQPFYQVYGHASPDGKLAQNKKLSEKRAALFRALMTGDYKAVVDIAKEEKWGNVQRQVMLRALHCDPGYIDGEFGPLTETAVRNFQTDYKDRVFHAHADLQPGEPGLRVDGVLGSNTFAALVESYVLSHSPFVDESRLHPTHPTIGCTEFNQVSNDGGPGNRRIALVVHEVLPELHDRAPCADGDHSLCPVDDKAPSRCLWYRAHVEDPPPEGLHAHIDPRWTPLPDGRVLLTALTSLQDDHVVDFQVFKSKPIGGPDEIGDACLDVPITEVITGTVRLGVAQAVWTPDEGYDPFEFDDWFEAVDADALAYDPNALWNRRPTVRAPLFRVRGGGAVAVSEPPGQDLRRIRIHDEHGAPATEAAAAWGFDCYGRAFQVDLDGYRQASTERPTSESHRAMYFEAAGYDRRGGRT